MACISWTLGEYLSAPGVGFFALIVVLFVITCALLGVRDWWLTIRADNGGGNDPSTWAPSVSSGRAEPQAQAVAVMILLSGIVVTRSPPS